MAFPAAEWCGFPTSCRIESALDTAAAAAGAAAATAGPVMAFVSTRTIIGSVLFFVIGIALLAHLFSFHTATILDFQFSLVKSFDVQPGLKLWKSVIGSEGNSTYVKNGQSLLARGDDSDPNVGRKQNETDEGTSTPSNICDDRRPGRLDVLSYNQRHSPSLTAFASPLTNGRGYVDQGRAQSLQNSQAR